MASLRGCLNVARTGLDRHVLPRAATAAASNQKRFVTGSGLLGRIGGLLALIAVTGAIITAHLNAQVNILTNRYDPGRTGANLVETKLTPANVNVQQFGKLYSYPVEGSVYAQPLYVRGVTIGGQQRNVLYVATMNDKVYAFDADSSSPAPLWMRDFTSPPSVTPIPITELSPGLNIIGNVGIQSTPVIAPGTDPGTGTIYLVARTKESGVYVQRLHALDIATGASKTGSPVTIAGSVPGTAPDATIDPSGAKVVTFNPKTQSQRAALALSNGVVLIAWASHEDLTPYHGWVMGYDADSLARVGIFCTTPDVYEGGIWQGGRAPTIDSAGNAYFATGNGVWDGTRNFGDSLLKFSVSKAGIALIDYFTPGNHKLLDADDDDLSGSSFTMLPGPDPGTNRLLGGGKEGVLYLLDPLSLGRMVPNDTQIPQRIPVAGGHVMGGPVFWNTPAAGTVVYNWSEDDVLKAYRLTAGKLELPAYARGQVASPGHPGGSLTVSANGNLAGTGVVWASMPTSQDGIHGLVAGVLRAYDAETLREVWTSEQNPNRDRAGTLMKFVPPIVVNGRVYMPNHNGAVSVYGLLPPSFGVAVTPASQVISPGAGGTFSVTVTAQNGFTGAVALSATSEPSGPAVSFSPASINSSGSSTMTVSLPPTAAGSFSITVKGTSGATAISAAPVVVSTSPSGNGVISIDFVGSSPAAMTPGEVGGVVPKPNWNSAAGAVRSTPLALADAAGTPTNATVTWSANGAWMTPITDQPGNARMMKGYLDTGSTTTTTVTVAGLASTSYDVYVYADGDNKVYPRSAAYTISGPGIATTTVNLTDAGNANFGGTFTRASNSNGNYVLFTITAAGFTLQAAPTTPDTGTRRAPINGIQIVPTAPVVVPGIGIDFTGSSTGRMAPTERAGVVPQANWNSAVGATQSTPVALVDEFGAATSAAVRWTANGAWMLPITDQPGNVRMMRGYLDTSTTSVTTVTVTGLAVRTYDVYVYADGDNREFNRSAAYTISGSGITTTTVDVTDPANTNFPGTFTRAAGGTGNYAKFSITAGGFTLTAAPGVASGTTRRAPVNGIQIVPR